MNFLKEIGTFLITHLTKNQWFTTSLTLLDSINFISTKLTFNKVQKQMWK